MATAGLQTGLSLEPVLRAPWGCWSESFEAFPLESPCAVTGWRHGVLLSQSAKAVGIWQRRWGYQASYLESWLDQRIRWRRGDCCWLHYSLPRSSPGFISLRYLVSGGQTSLKTVRNALCGLEEVARLLRSYAIVCSSSNGRLNDAVMGRFGFERHAIRVPGHHFIKRLREWKDPDVDRQPLEPSETVSTSQPSV